MTLKSPQPGAVGRQEEGKRGRSHSSELQRSWEGEEPGGGAGGALIHFLELEQMCRTSGVPLPCLGVL